MNVLSSDNQQKGGVAVQERAADLGELRRSDGSVAGTAEVPATAPRPADLFERERRRAVHAESRLAEVAAALREAIEKSGAQGIPRDVVGRLLDGVEDRIVALNEELAAGGGELEEIASMGRRYREEFERQDGELRVDLERVREELRDSLQSDEGGLPELAQQRMQFEIEIDRLQSLLGYRDNVCRGLSEDLRNGSRVAAEVTTELADLARGRVTPARRAKKVDGRAAGLRRDLDHEREQVLQTRRALEAARAELRSAREKSTELEERDSTRVAQMESERVVLEEALQDARLSGDRRERELRSLLAEERTRRLTLTSSVCELEDRERDLREALESAPGDRETAARRRLEELRSRYEEAEGERIRLAERVSLLQAALSSRELGGANQEPRRATVLSLVRRRADADESPDSVATEHGVWRQREHEIDQLSRRWRELQGAYRDAVDEFDTMRQRRDSLLLRLRRDSYGAPNLEGEDLLDQDGIPLEDLGTLGHDGERPSVARKLSQLIHIEDCEAHCDALSALSGDLHVSYSDGRGSRGRFGHDDLLVVNLSACGGDVLRVLPSVVSPLRAASVWLYGGNGESGRVIGAVDLFPAPFDAAACVEHLVRQGPPLRRVLAVGEAVEAMGTLREELGEARCSTAVAFDTRQARDLIPIVRPQYVLIDLSLAGGAGLELLAELAADANLEIRLGVTWSVPVEPAVMRSWVDQMASGSVLSPAELAAAVERELCPPEGSPS